MARNINFGKALKNAVSGLKYMVRSQRNARIHLAATILVTLIGIWLNLSITDWVLIVIAIGLVWIAELFNTSLECFFDLVEPEDNKYVKAGKDTAAAAVLITSLLSAVIGILILAPPFFQKVTAILKNL